MRKILLALAISALGILAILAFLDAGQFINLSRKNPVRDIEEYKSELKVLRKGDDHTDKFAREVIVQVQFGTAEETLGLIPEPELPGSYVAPGAMAVARNGDIYVADPANRAVKIYSQQGEYKRKIAFDHDLLRDFGLDARDNLYVLSFRRLYRKPFDQEAFQAIGPALNEAHNLDVTPSGHVSVLDKLLPDDNLRVQKLDEKDNVLKTVIDRSRMLEFEDELGHAVSLFRLGGGPAGVQYKITPHAAPEQEVVYEGYVPRGYYYDSLEVLGFDEKGGMYFLRIISPGMPAGTPEEPAEKMSKTEVWVDILDIQRGTTSSVRLEPDKRLAGPYAIPNHTYDVDLAGNIYQSSRSPWKIPMREVDRGGGPKAR